MVDSNTQTIYPDPDDPPLIVNSKSQESETNNEPEKKKKENESSSSEISEEENLIRCVLYYKCPFHAMGLQSSANLDEINKKYKKVRILFVKKYVF